jgi:hypothetical protein
LPVIWQDEQWDQCYLFKVLAQKFCLMEKFYKSDCALSADRLKAARRIKVCRILCQRLYLDDYSTRWGDPTITCFDFEDFAKKIYTAVDIRGMHVDAEHAEYMQKQDLDLLCKMMKKHANTWWD